MQLPKYATATSLVVIGVTLLAGKQIPESTTPLFDLNVTAVDGHGQPVTDLRTEDFQILDNGKPRKAAWLRPVSRRGLPAATFILIDLYNEDLEARGLGENEVVRSLERLDISDNGYLYLLTPAATFYPVRGVSAPYDAQWSRRVKPMRDDARHQVNGLKSGNSLYADLRIGPTWQALSGMASQIAQVPGPKSFVWITQGVENGFWQPGHQFVRDTKYLRDWAAVVNALETAVYTVQQKPGGSLELQNEGSGGETLNQLSALTGGKSYQTDRTEEAIAQAMNGARGMNYRMAFLSESLD